MNEYDKAQDEAAELLVSYAVSFVNSYTDHPGDVDAALVALLVSALEKVANREITIERLWIC